LRRRRPSSPPCSHMVLHGIGELAEGGGSLRCRGRWPGRGSARRCCGAGRGWTDGGVVFARPGPDRCGDRGVRFRAAFWVSTRWRSRSGFEAVELVGQALDLALFGLGEVAGSRPRRGPGWPARLHNLALPFAVRRDRRIVVVASLKIGRFAMAVQASRAMTLAGTRRWSFQVLSGEPPEWRHVSRPCGRLGVRLGRGRGMADGELRRLQRDAGGGLGRLAAADGDGDGDSDRAAGSGENISGSVARLTPAFRRPPWIWAVRCA
jgi:hypothetical protein